MDITGAITLHLILGTSLALSISGESTANGSLQTCSSQIAYTNSGRFMVVRGSETNDYSELTSDGDLEMRSAALEWCCNCAAVVPHQR
ncbi:hypothetical protein ASPBRDRAFT_400075 [Aspergillus brasiliensis CBS 101740]|uniref:Pectate lyase n=1 Tax=Aspergillus brasiliensis (strain CBS 101740 / IMI 381727 / IBT 21946) TaxID=767769 RepID=A0A1L9UX76_ASPBC|nr:hypothetical protein ASPBRDRAFT_400075 [Aspergillus brasiliensis CBS 101740]